MKHSPAMRRLQYDAMLIFASILLVLILMHIGVLEHLLSFAQGTQLLGAFIAGLCFVSAFTVPFATVALGAIGLTSPPLLVAFSGALGAVVSDVLMFIFIRDRLNSDLKAAMRRRTYRATVSFFRGGIMRWLAPVIGGIIIASPLPDELGLAFMGLSRLPTFFFIPIAFSMNFLGILAIVSIARAM